MCWLLALALLKLGGLLIDHVELAVAAHDLAVGATFLDGCAYFHNRKCCGMLCYVLGSYLKR